MKKKKIESNCCKSKVIMTLICTPIIETWMDIMPFEQQSGMLLGEETRTVIFVLTTLFFLFHFTSGRCISYGPVCSSLMSLSMSP
jgi:hypothetical protein